MKLDACLLHFVVEEAGLGAGQLHLGIEKAIEARWIVAVDGGLDMPSIHEHTQLCGRDLPLRAGHRIGGLDDGAHFKSLQSVSRGSSAQSWAGWAW